MYRTPRPAFGRACDCDCPAHRGQQRRAYNNPGCRCLAICSSQPMTLLIPQTNGAAFLDRDDVLWYVPGLEPGHWDWRNATPVGIGHPLSDTGDLIAKLLYATREGLLSLTHRL